MVIVGIAAWYVLDFAAKPAGDTSSNASSTVVDLSKKSDRYAVELVPARSPAPSLTRPTPSTSPTLDASARAQLITNIEATISRLKTDPNSYSDWMLLGIERQTLGDYAGAAEAWSYVTKRAPNDATPYGNLANLYAVYLKDYARAEANYKTAISLSPSTANYYANLHEVYRYNLKDSTKAVNILKQGIQNIPKEVSLYVTLARYYKDLGQKDAARAEFDAAISAAAGNSTLIADLQAEKDSF